VTFALKAIEKPESFGPLLESLLSPPYDPAVARLAGKLGSKDQLSYLLKIVAQKDHPLMKSAALGLVEAAEDRQLRPNGETLLATACSNMLDSKDDEVVAAGCRLVGLWRRGKFDSKVIRLLQREDVPYSVHKAAAFALAELGHPFLSEPNKNPAKFSESARIATTCALVRRTPASGANIVVELLRDKRSEVEIEELLNAVLTKRNAIIPFAKALDASQPIPADNAIHIRRLVETSGIKNGELLAALSKLGSVQRSPRSMDQLALLVEQSARGNVAQGREIFQRAELTCIKCHAVKGKGGEIGPDLSSIGAAAPVDYLIESLLAPSNKIKEGYRMSVIITEDGDAYSGTVVREDDRIVLIRNAVGQENRILKSKIESRETSGTSMMPSGLTANLPDEEFLDLIAYLSSLGRAK
jgi:putative heme-binding domain-containing protein